MEIEGAGDGSSGSAASLTPEQSQAIARCWAQLTNEQLRLALAVRDDRGRAWSARVAKALGETCDLYVPIPDVDYNRNAYHPLATELQERHARRLAFPS